MIKTRYNLTLEIDNESFNITLSEPNAAQKEEMTLLANESSAIYEKRALLQSELDEKIEEYELNKLLTKESGVIDKVKLLLEQKKLNKEIYALHKCIAEIDKSNTNINEALNTLYKKRFDLLVSGADKVKLKEAIENKGVEYRVLFGALGKLVIEAKEKK